MSFDPFSFAGSLVTGMLNNSSAQERQDSANTFSAQQYASRYQTTVSDMQAAGLNPALAYGGISGSPPSSAMASSVGTPDLGANYTQAKMATAQVANINADTANKDAQKDLMEAQAAAQRASAWSSNADIERTNMQVKEIQQKLENQYYTSEVDRLKAVTKELESAYRLNLEKGLSEQQSRNVMYHQILSLDKDISLKQFDIDAIKKFDNFGKEYKQYAPIVDLIKSIFLPRSGGITINK